MHVVDRKKGVAATLGVLQYIEEEKEIAERSRDAEAVAPWALSGRLSMMQSQILMQYRIPGTAGKRLDWSRAR